MRLRPGLPLEERGAFGQAVDVVEMPQVNADRLYLGIPLILPEENRLSCGGVRDLRPSDRPGIVAGASR